MSNASSFSVSSLVRDLTAGMVVFFVALPLCLGVAQASGAEAFSGVVAGIVGGLLVGLLSGSHSSVSGPAAGLTTIVAAQIGTLGFRSFLLAVLIAGVIQVGLGIIRAGFLQAFVPSSVIKGLLAAIGVILILKQIPHLFGHDASAEGEMSFWQVDNENTFSELARMLADFHVGAAMIGLVSIAVLLTWDRVKVLKKSVVPAPLIVVVLGVAMYVAFGRLGGYWAITTPDHLVGMPIPESLPQFFEFFVRPDFSQWLNPAIYTAALTLAIVGSLETLLNLEAVDKIDPRQRISPPSRELVAQGFGNILAGMLGGLPVTSVIVRSSVNINAGAQSKLSTMFHGGLLLGCAMLMPQYLNMIPKSCLAAILIVTGAKLASPKLIKQMWDAGRYQFIPFAVTLTAIVLTDLLIGVAIGLVISVGFILFSNLKRPMHRVLEKHLGGEVLRIELANQVSFLNRAALDNVLNTLPTGGHVLIDATNTDYIDPDILALIRDFKATAGPARNVQMSLKGFKDKYQLQDEIQFIDYSTRELQEQLSPGQVLQILKEGNERFRTGHRLSRDLGRQLNATAAGQHPLAVVLSCIDSRTPSELIFDLGLGDIFSVRVAGNVISPKVLGSLEYSCAVAGAKLVLVMGHTRCGAVSAAVQLACSKQNAEQATGCQNLEPIISYIQDSIDMPGCQKLEKASVEEKSEFIDSTARQNVLRTVESIYSASPAIARLAAEGKIEVVGAMYDVSTGVIDFLTANGPAMLRAEAASGEGDPNYSESMKDK